MAKYTDTWQNMRGEAVVSETRPDEYSYPIVSMSRVRGFSYRPYATGSPAWREAANEALASHARSNFEMSQYRGR